ncbi:MAG TPA: LPXTG cell wall anchor domain-containing protein [Acidimicrobiales bacterium]|nr:LPXTG cell wall anchor domain-containing protein [Acidimicrobiales bacterium]
MPYPLLVAVALVSVLGLALAPPASAQTYGPQPVSLSCTVATSPSLSLRCTATGFAAAAEITLRIFPGPTNLGVVQADATGTATANVALPAVLSAGEHRVEATGVAANGQTVTAVTTVVIPALGSELPRTGDNSALPLVSAGSALVAIGALLVLAVRKRRSKARVLAAA